MTRKNIEKEVLEALLSSQDWISGGDLANKLHLSRNTIWRNIKKLQSKGYAIETTTGKGYRLTKPNDEIDSDEIKIFLNHPDKYEIHCFQEVDSTNTDLKQAAREGAKAGTVFVANAQNAGKGRLGRNFFSPYGTGVYFSLLLRPINHQHLSQQSPALAAVSLAKALDRLIDAETQIKWVNDLYLKEKKIVGILSEGEIDFESQEIKYIVIGIGVNVYPPTDDFPKDIKNRAGSITSNTIQNGLRNRIVAEFLNEWEFYSEEKNKEEALSIFREKNYLAGKQVNVRYKDEKINAKVLDINEQFELTVQDEKGNIIHINHGEATLHHE